MNIEFGERQMNVAPVVHPLRPPASKAPDTKRIILIEFGEFEIE